MRIIICDDEARYRELLHEKLLQDSIAHDYEAEIVECRSGEELLEALEKGERADIYFLDIQMENGTDDGIRVGKRLRSLGEKGLIVYVTGFIDYVQVGYEVKAFRYLLKSQIGEKLPEVIRAAREELAGEEYFSFQVNRETVRVDRRKILYLESDRRQLHLIAEAETFCFYGSLDEAHEALGEGFVRCHRSYLVNIGQIKKYSREQISLKNGDVLPISRSYVKECLHRLMLEMI